MQEPTVDGQTPSRQDIIAEHERLQATLQATGIGTWEIDLNQNSVRWDDRCRALFGFSGNEPVSYAQVLDLIHPDDREEVNQAIQRAIDPQSGVDYDVQFRTNTSGFRWLRGKGQAFYDEYGKAYKFLGINEDITSLVDIQQQKQAITQQLEASEERYRMMFELAPVAIGILRGESLIIETANSKVLEILHKPASIIGKPWLEAMPELIGQPAMDIIHTVYRTGIPFTATEFPAMLENNGQLEQGYYSFSYIPLKEQGTVTGILQVAVNVTDQVVARHKIEVTHARLLQTSQRLSLALDAGQLGSYDLELDTGLMECTAQCKINFGMPSDVPFNFPDLMAVIAPEDREQVQKAVTYAIDNHNVYYAEYRISWPDGTLHWIKASGLPTDILDGKPTRIIGVTQDITVQRQAQDALEEQVQQRTHQLLLSNQELKRSNDNLQQFAYIASHDLQEPLRKIQSFGTILKQQYSEPLGDGSAFIDRMESAANRMSVLIRDLLAFARISTRQEATTLVSLNRVVEAVVSDLDMVINETGAVLDIGSLPEVQGDESQLGQLFQNLVSNALKFRRTDPTGALVTPQIRINAQSLKAAELPPAVAPSRQSQTYYRIDVTDNGIGFDEKYLDRIFQVFQRLHGRNEFSGTGIGLAICEKVVANHGGAITASSKPGQGATFSVYLPQ